MPPELDPAAAPAPAPAAAPIEPSTPPAEPAAAPAPAPAAPAPAAPIEEPVAAAPVVPEKYELKVPDGFYDNAAVERVSAKAKDMKLTAEAAQHLMDAAVAEVVAFDNAVKAGFERTVAKWEADAKADPEIGGANLSKNLELTKMVLARFGSEDLVKELNSTGFGSHPEMIRMISKIGRAMKEDDFLIPGSVEEGTGKKDAAEILYGSKQ